MAANPKLIFYDIETIIPGLPTSSNTWRVRLVLNYKNLPYETVWSSGPGIAETCIAAGIPPLEKRDDGSPRYTMPALADVTNPDAPVHLCDSRKIIEYLEETYPDPNPRRTLFPPGTHGLQMLADQYISRIIQPTASTLILYGMAQKQTPRSRPVFERYAPPGKTLAEADPCGKERDEVWTRLRSEFDKLASHAEGDVFFSGNHLRYFDVHVLAALLSINLSIGDEEFEKELGPSAGGRWMRLLKACSDLIK